MRKTTLAMLILVLTASGWLHARDPMQPPSAAEIRAWIGEDTGARSHSPWQLQSVLIANDRRIAVVNGERKRVGDTVNGAEVIRIEPGRVVLDTGTQEIALTIDSRATSWRDPSRD